MFKRTKKGSHTNKVKEAFKAFDKYLDALKPIMPEKLTVSAVVMTAIRADDFKGEMRYKTIPLVSASSTQEDIRP